MPANTQTGELTSRVEIWGPIATPKRNEFGEVQPPDGTTDKMEPLATRWAAYEEVEAQENFEGGQFKGQISVIWTMRPWEGGLTSRHQLRRRGVTYHIERVLAVGDWIDVHCNTLPTEDVVG